MNQNCAVCTKVVYPTEKIVALDSAFHKGCFKCNECAITLNLKTFQSFEQKLYCKTHLPKPQAQGLNAETKETQRLKNVANMVSNVQYKAEFEKMKGDAGSFGAVGIDAPAMKVSMKNSNQISNIKYHAASQDGASNMAQPRMMATPPQSRVKSQAQPEQAPVQQQEYAELPEQGAVSDAKYLAKYNYHPEAEDELAFDVGDQIVNAQLIADGWLYGTNARTGKSGLLPEPYCEMMA